MNLKLFPNDVKVDFVVGNKELFRIPDEIKQIAFNKSGFLVGISTKLNKFYIFDYFGHNLIGIIIYFHDRKYNIKNFCFDYENNLYIAYEFFLQGNINNSGIKKINLELGMKNTIHNNLNNKDEYIIPVSDEKSENQIFNELTNAKIFQILFDKDKLLVCGNNPYIYDFKTKDIFYFIKQESISFIKKDLQIFIDNNDKTVKINGKKEEKNNDEISNNHFIIPNNIDFESNYQNNSVDDNKNDDDNINKSNNFEGNKEKKNNNPQISINNNSGEIVQNNGEIKEVDIKVENNNILNNENLSSDNNNIEIKIPQKKYNPYSIFIRFGYNSTTFYFIVKELYIFLILHLKQKNISKNENDMIVDEIKYPTFDEVIKTTKPQNSYSYKQIQFINFIKEELNDQFYVSKLFCLNMNGEIIHVELNTRNNLILINSTDRIVRLFEIINDSIILQKEYCDSVSKRKYTNCYFYTYKLKSGIQDLILLALNDANGLEFFFKDIVSGNLIKKLETFKYTVQDFICHYQNHFSILVISGKKVFCINGVMANQFDCLAPGLKYLEENVEYIEDESFYDNFDEKMKQQIQMQNNHEEKIEEIFSKRVKKDENIFIKVDYDNEIKTNDNIEREKSINELKELFAYVGQQIQ